MDCCCKQDQSIITQYSVDNVNTNINIQNIPKLKYSFRTQQATPHHSKINTINTMNATNYQTMNNNNNTMINTNYNTNNNNTLHNTSSLVNNYSQPQKQQKMYSTVASNNELLQLQRQRQQLINQDRQLDTFYHTKIIPLEKEVQFFQHQVKVRNIQIMELQDLLSQRVKQKQSIQNINQQHNHVQSNIINHSMLRGQGNHLPVIQNINLNQNIPMRQIVPAQQQQSVPVQQQQSVPVQQQQSVPVQHRHNVPIQGPFIINQQAPQSIKVVRQQSIILPQQNILHQINKPAVVNSQVVIRPQPIRH